MTEQKTDELLKKLEQDVKQREKSANASNKVQSEQPKRQSSRAATQPVPQKRNWLGSFNLLLTLLLITATGYGAWYAYNTSQQMTQQLQQQNVMLTGAQQSLAQSSQQIEQLQQQLTEQQQQQLQTQQALTSAQQHLAKVTGRRTQDWLLAEADYLVQMAGRKLWLEKDIDTAIAMLTAADQRITTLNDSSLLPIRQALSSDIAALSALPRLAQPELALRLGGLIESVDQLKIQAVQLPDVTELQVDTEVSDSVADWRQNLIKVWQGLVNDFITVDKRASDVQPMMSPQQSWYLRENVKQQLLQAQIALLKEQKQLYQQAIAQSSQWLNGFFDGSDPAVQNALEQLQQFKEQQVSRTLPSALASGQLIKDAMQQRLNNLYHVEQGTLETEANSAIEALPENGAAL